MDFIDASKTPFHAVNHSAFRLKEAGFTPLNLRSKWNLRVGGRYFADYGTAIAAFRIASKDGGFHIVGSHTDSPAVAIKPKAVIKDNGYVKLNTEIYGGPILNTWLDRPLSIAGRVLLRSDDPMEPTEVLVDFERPVAVIPNLAIHLNREVNKGIELNRQKDMLPLVSLAGDFISEDYLVHKLAEYLKIEKQGILNYELYLYDPRESCFVGFSEDFISAPRLDNLAMLHASLDGLIGSSGGKGVKIAVGFDSEEVGSLSRSGADSTLLKDLIDRIGFCLDLREEDMLCSLERSFIISADMAHAVHPNSPEKHDPTNRPKINGGPVIKLSANKKYTTDGLTSAIFRNLCEDVGVPCQTFVNPSDQVGGSTIGPISSRHVSIKSVDVGNPMLAMHSLRELVGSDDQYYMVKVLRKFFSL